MVESERAERLAAIAMSNRSGQVPGMESVANGRQSSRMLGEYRVIKDIAEGTFGKVKSKH